MFRVFVALMLLTVVFITARGVRAGAIKNFRDDFTSSQLRAAWTWEDPGGTSLHATAKGSLDIGVSKASDQWIGVDYAPRLLKSPPLTATGEWSIETRILSSDGNTQTFPGLTVYAGRQNWLLWGWVGGSSLEASGIADNRFTGPLGVMATRYQYLRIRKAGVNYYFDASADGVNWTNANVYRDDSGLLQGARVGLMAKDWNKGTGSSYVVRFDYFKEQDSDPMPSALTAVQGTTLLAQETGVSSLNSTERVDVCGADLGINFVWQARTYFAFGDTKACNKSGSYRRSNTLAFSSDDDPSDGVSFDGWVTGTDDRAKELFAHDPGSVTAIPTGAVGISDRAYIFYMDVTNWDSAGDWDCSETSIASSTSDEPDSWIKHNKTIQWSAGNFNQLAANYDAATSMLYVWGTPCGRFGSVKLMRVPDASILRKSAYQYFAGYDTQNRPVWTSSETQAKTVAGGPVGELSVRFNSYLNQYVMTYLDVSKHSIVMRGAPNPWGPWSAPIVIASEPPYSRLYGAFMSDVNNGKSFYYMMSMAGPYNTYWMQTTLQ